MSKLHLKDQPTMADFQQYVHDMCIERGFEEETLSQKFMLLSEEVGELAKAARKSAGIATDATYKPTNEAAAHEAADVLIVLLTICDLLGIDLEQAFREKEEKNKSRNWK